MTIAAIALLAVAAGDAIGLDPAAAVRGVMARYGPAVAWTCLLSPALVAALLVHWGQHAASHGREMRERREAIRRAELRARHDALTGALNRHGLFDAVMALAPQVRERRQDLAVMVLDLDHFKNVNDLHGHLIGDEVMRIAVARMRECCPEDTLIARIGGDEFALAVAYEPAMSGAVDAVARAMVRNLSRPNAIGDLRLHIGASIGIATTAKSGWDQDALLRRADVAMYRAKQAGRNCHRWFDRSMEAELQQRAAIEGELRLAIPGGQIVPFYEPQIDFRTGRVSGVEVLARWVHPARGLVPPSQFIPVAEETGMISDLSFAVIEQALAEARDWDPAIRLAVNISPMQLRDPLLAQRLLKLLLENAFPPERLEVEITESALLEDLPTAKAVVNSLKNQGVRLALDDFGTGYSSLHHLRALPFDRIKIDRSFVSSILENEESEAIVHAVLGLGDSLGIEVTAEGVETREVADRLCALKCCNGQGYYYSAPVPGRQVAEIVAGIAARPVPLPTAAGREDARLRAG